MNLYYYRLKIDPGFIHSDHAYQEYMRGDHHNKTWVDLGCGTNPFISEYKVNFNHAIGIDSDFHALRRAEKPACCADITQLPVKDESVDLTSSYMVFEHVTNPQSATNAIFRILRPGGMFICCTVSRKYWVSRLNTVLNEQVKKALLKWIFNKKQEDIYPAVYRFNDPDIIRQTLTHSGFSNIVIKPYAEYYTNSRLLFWIQHWLNKYLKPYFMISTFLITATK